MEEITLAAGLTLTVAAISAWVSIIAARPLILAISHVIAVLSELLLLGGFIFRWSFYADAMGTGWLRSFPVTTFFEAIVFCIVCTLILFACFAKRLGTAPLTAVVYTVCAGILLALTLSAVPTQPVLFLPSLQSGWLIAHVLLCFVGYAFFTLSAFIGLEILTGKSSEKEKGKQLIRMVECGLLFFTVGGIIFGPLREFTGKATLSKKFDMRKELK